MSTEFQEKCFRCLNNCMPISNISSNDGGSFICVGYNKKLDRELLQDRFTVCWKNDVIDERSHWDKRDIVDTISVLSNALSIDENIMAGQNLTEQQMRDADTFI